MPTDPFQIRAMENEASSLTQGKSCSAWSKDLSRLGAANFWWALVEPRPG
jgi:hypothetical protein